MKKIAVKVVAGIFSILLLSVSMTACSNKQESDDKDKVKKTEIFTPDSNATPEPEEKSIMSNQMCKQGEDISEIDVQNGEVIRDALIYTIKNVTIFADIAKAGISEEAMPPSNDESILDENGKLKQSVKFLIIGMTVKNICALPDRNITSFSLLCADSTKGTQDNAGEIAFFELPLPSYFSNPSGSMIGEDWKRYYDYRLPVGQSKDIKVGWYIDLDQYDLSELYLMFNSGDDEYGKYVKLELK